MRITEIRTGARPRPPKGQASFFLTGGVPAPPSWVPFHPPQIIEPLPELVQPKVFRMPWLLTGGVPPPPPYLPPRKALVFAEPELVVFNKRPPSFYLLGNYQTLQPLFVSSTNQVFTPSFINTADMQLFLAGAEISWMESTLNIDLIWGGIGKATFSIYGTTAYRPAYADEVIFYRKGVRRFGGFVLSVQDSLVPKTRTHILQVTCVDFNGFMNRVIVAKLYTLPIGALAWIIIFDLIQVYLAQFGVSFAGFENAGAGVGQVLFHYVTMAAAIAQLTAAAPNVVFWIDAYKLAHFSPVGGAAPGGYGAAPYSLSETSDNFLEFIVSPDGSLYRNRQWLLPSSNLLSLRVENFTGDGTTTGFFTLYVLQNPPVVSVNGANQIVAALGGPYPAGWTWYYIPNGQGFFQRPGATPLSNLDTLSVAYPNPFALAISVQNDAEIALRGLVEAIAQPQNVNDLATAEVMASGMLNAFCPDVPLTITFTTNENIDPAWLTPGMSITVQKAIPYVPSASFMVQEVNSQEIGLGVFFHRITLRANSGNNNPQAGALTLSQGALAATNNDATETAGFELALTYAGNANPGLATGAILNRYIFLYDGVLSFWSILFASDPPTGADMIIDALLNGVSIFPASSTLKIVLSAGQATEAQGYLFSSNNLAVKKGDVLTLNVIQVGSVNPGSNGVVRVVTVR